MPHMQPTTTQEAHTMDDRARTEAIVADIIGALQARDIYTASGEHAAAAALTREIGTYGGGYVAVAMQRHARARG
jgi:hypothetical protein